MVFAFRVGPKQSSLLNMSLGRFTRLCVAEREKNGRVRQRSGDYFHELTTRIPISPWLWSIGLHDKVGGTHTSPIRNRDQLDAHTTNHRLSLHIQQYCTSRVAQKTPNNRNKSVWRDDTENLFSYRQENDS